MNEELYQKLYDAQYYTKSYDDFKAKYGTPEGQQDLYNKLSSAQFYTKDFDSFKQKYFNEEPPKSKSVSFWDKLRNSVPFVRPIVNAIDSIIPEQTKEAVGSMVDDYSKVNTEPPKPNFFENAIKRGTNLAKQAEIVNPFSESPNPAQIQELASIQQENQNLPPSESYAKFNNSQSFGEALDNFSKDPARIILELTTESLSSLAQYGLTRVGAGAATGAAMGSVVPGIGTAAGAGSGAIVGLADTSLGLEYSSAFMDSLKEAGVDVNNPSSLEKAFQDDAIISEARAHGLKKGIPIALFDLISGGVAGKIVTNPAKSILGKVAQGASEFGVQAALGGTGELSGQLVAGEEIQPGAILGEMIGELGTTPVEVGLGASSRIKNTLKQSNEVINKVADTGSNEINAAIDADATLTKEEQEQLANKIKENEKEQTKKGKQKELLTDTQAGIKEPETNQTTPEGVQITFDQTPEFQAANQKIREIAEQIRENPQDRTLTTKLNEAIQEQDNARIAFEKRPKREKQPPIVVTNPAQALKEQIQQHYRTLEQGIKKGQKMTNESLLSKVEDILKKATKAGFNFTNQQFNSIVNKVKSSNLFTPGSLSKLQNYVDNVFNDAEYLNKINEAKLINKKLRRLSKTSSSNLQSIKSLAKSFTKINPEDTFINEHLMEANKLLSALTTPTSKGYSITNLSDTEEYINRKIDEANEYLEKETASVSEDNSDDLTNRLKTKLKESLKALQSKDLSEFDDSERTAIEDIKRTNPDLLEKASLIRAIRVIDNIVENDNLSNEAELRTDVKSLEVLNEIETLLKGKKLGVPTGFYAKLTYSVARTWERIIGDNTLVAKIKLAMGQQGITDASSKTETQLNKRAKEIEKVLQIFEKETQQPFMDVSNRAKVLVYSLLVRHPQGADTSTVIQKMKDNIVKSISEYRIAEETEIANAMQSAYDEVKDLNTLEEIESTWSAKNPSHRKVFDYFTNMFKELTDEQESIQSRLFNKSYLRENNYTHFTVLNLNGEKKQVTTDKSGAKSTIKPKEATTSIKATRSLPPGSVYSLDFIHDQLEAYGETYYKNKASDSMLLINKVMNNPKFNEIFGKKTADIIRKQSNQINDIYSGIGGAPSSQFIKLLSAGTKLSRELAAAQTLGSISQVPKQFLPVLVKSISFHLSKGSFPILLRSLGIRGEGVNKLHELYPVGTVGLRLGGIDRGDTISYNLSAGSGKKISKFLEDSLKISRKLVRGSLFWLTTPDRFAKKATWNSYYLLRLKELGVTDVNMAAEYSLQKDPRRREAAAYAEQMLSTTQISSNPAEFSDITSNKGNNAEKIIKNVLLPFAVYSIEVKARLVNNTIKAFKRPTSENIVGGIIGDLLEIATFEAIAMFLIPQYKEFLDDIWRDIFDLEKPDEDEDKKKEKILKTGLSRAVNTINPFAIGSIGEEVGNRSINLLAFKALADDPDMDYKTWKKETGGFAYEDKFDFGLLTLGYKPAFNIYNNTVNLQRASDDEKISYEDDYGNVYDVYLDENQKKLLALNLLAEISSLSGANEADLFNSLRRVYKEQVKMQKKQPYNK